MSLFKTKATSVVVLAATFLIACPAQAACTVSSKDGATTLECDPQTMSKAKGGANNRVTSTAPSGVFVAPNGPAGNIAPDNASRTEAASLRPMTTEERNALEAAQPRK